MWICERCVKCTGCTPQLITIVVALSKHSNKFNFTKSSILNHFQPNYPILPSNEPISPIRLNEISMNPRGN